MTTTLYQEEPLTDTIEVPLANNRGHLLIDSVDEPLVAQYPWRIQVKPNSSYAITGKSGPTRLQAHRLIMNAPRHLLVDHQNGNGLDCRRSNMRLATYSQNNANARSPSGCSSQFTGVYWNQRDHRWVAAIRIEGKKVSLGYFMNEEEAAIAYDQAAVIHHREFARLNFP